MTPLVKAIRLVEHIPTFIETDTPPKRDDVDTVTELLDLGWVRRWRDGRGFFRFSLSSDTELLIAEFDGGARWFVVGTIYTKRGVGADVSALPTWTPPRETT